MRRAGWPSEGFAVAAGNLVLLTCGLASGVVSARWLGPDGRGIYVAATTWSAFAGILLSFGVPQSVVLDREPAPRLTRPILSHLSIGTGSALVAGLFLSLTHNPNLSREGLVGFCLIAGASIASGIAAGLAQRYRRMRLDYQIARIAAPVASLLVMAVLILSGDRAPNTWLFVTGLAAFLASCASLARCLEWDLVRSNGWLYDASFLRNSLGACGVALATQALYRQDNLVSAVTMRHERVAEYAVGSAAMTACVAAAQAAGMVLFSRLRQTPPERVRQQAWLGVRSSALTAGIVGLPIAILSGPLVRLAYGGAFASAIPSVQVLAVAAVPLAMDYTLANVLLSVGCARELITCRLLTIVLGTTLLVWLSRHAGLGAYSTGTLMIYVASVIALAALFIVRGPSATNGQRNVDLGAVESIEARRQDG